VTAGNVREKLMAEKAEHTTLNRVILLGFDATEYFSAHSVFVDALGPCTIEGTMDITTISERDSMVQTIVLQASFIAFKGDRLIRDIKKRFPNVPIICYSYSVLGTMLGVRLADAGVNIIFANLTHESDYKNCISLIRMRGVYYPSDVRARREDRFTSKMDAFKTLTPREWETLDYSMQGLSLKQIAEKMDVAIGTAGTYRGNIKDKMGLENFTQVLLLAKEYRAG